MKLKLSGVLFLGLILAPFVSNAIWKTHDLPNLPMTTTNNAVSSALVNDTIYLYSFGGIDSSKIWSGVHKKSFRYSMTTKVWESIPDMPDSLGGVIAAGASNVEGKIYIMGGYHINENGSEVSSYENRIYDPATNTYSRGANIPVPIDDHVQVIYRHYIYIITGWSHTLGGGNNSNLVQIYDTRNDKWLSGTSTPNTSRYKVFGANGMAFGNKIYYVGGARFSNNFPLTSVMRIGTIDPSDPSSITWTDEDLPNGYKPYRGISFYHAVNGIGSLVFIGGSEKSYNYDGTAYDGSGAVKPSTRVLLYGITNGSWGTDDAVSVPMDLRGFAFTNPGSPPVLIGGMDSNQNVLNSVSQLSFETVSGVPTEPKLFTNYRIENSNVIVEDLGFEKIQLTNMNGQLLRSSNSHSISIDGIATGTYIIHLFKSPDLYTAFKIAL